MLAYLSSYLPGAAYLSSYLPGAEEPSALDKRVDAIFKAKEWERQLKREIKARDGDISKIRADEAKLQKEIHAEASKGNVGSVQVLAKSVVRLRKTTQRMEMTKVKMQGVLWQLSTSVATVGATGALRRTTDCIRDMNSIARISEVGGTIQEMRREMQKCADAEDSIEEAMQCEGEEEETAEEVQRVLEEMALEKMGPLSALCAVPPAKKAGAPAAVAPRRMLVAAGGCPQPARRPAAAAQVPAPAPEAPSASEVPASVPAPEAPAASEALVPSSEQALFPPPSAPPAWEVLPAASDKDTDLLDRAAKLGGRSEDTDR